MLRGRNEDFLSLDIEVDADDTSPIKPVERKIAAAYHIGATLPGDRWLMEVAGWAWRVKLSLTLSLDLMRDLRERAEEEAINVFARDLKDLLLAAPAGSRVTMGLDPGIRTGVKVAVVDGTGKLLDTTTVYPFPPKNDVRGTQAELASLVRKHKIELIAIGNGTGSRRNRTARGGYAFGYARAKAAQGHRVGSRRLGLFWHPKRLLPNSRSLMCRCAAPFPSRAACKTHWPNWSRLNRNQSVLVNISTMSIRCGLPARWMQWLKMP